MKNDDKIKKENVEKLKEIKEKIKRIKLQRKMML